MLTHICFLQTNKSWPSSAFFTTTTPPNGNNTNPKCLIDGKASSNQYVFVLVCGQILLGIGGSPIFTLGTTYIDNHVSKESSSMYLGEWTSYL
jgi:hypothetical protein